MSIEVSPETEARLSDEARKQGITVSALVERLINERRGTGASPSNTALPVWHLGNTGHLHRRDIYNDVS
jgi:hypothetical protein